MPSPIMHTWLFLRTQRIVVPCHLFASDEKDRMEEDGDDDD
eukprot:CAMPEP_0185736112 /NCGR_PEP_ID=MMETSP1171-20130828/26947_1 /TAXON_ID=374046 /ORGANISM="Helicotheca tamensis, Strain CCMP826" /LENGTH=40 /DNA_ID= /DNA_START= /DNA_END= /DNA_ORIENTATION=